MGKKRESEDLRVDDEEDFIQNLAQSLEMLGLKAADANCGEEAVQLVDNQNYDAMVHELVMPGRDGLEPLEVFYS